MARSTSNIPAGIITAGQTALEQVVTRVPDLPRPVAAVVGAGDKAAERITALSGDVTEVIDNRRAQLNLPAAPSADDVRTAAAQLPAKVQGFATELPTKMQGFASDLPNRAQGLAGDLPAKSAGFRCWTLPGKVQGLAGDAQEFAGELPGKVQKYAGDAVRRRQGRRRHGGPPGRRVGRDRTGEGHRCGRSAEQ